MVNSLADEKVFSTHTGLKMCGEFKGVRLNQYNCAHALFVAHESDWVP